MPLPVKVSDRLLALAREEAQGTHRSTTAQIEHWATLGRAVETMMAYRDVLRLKRVGQTLPLLADIRRDDVHELLFGTVHGLDRASVTTRIRAGGAPIYTEDPTDPTKVIEVREDGTRTSGHLRGRQFVPDAAGGRRLKVAARMVKRRPGRGGRQR
jgi:ParD-like antitoxin of type II bacterial toxin-antitoxin system